MRVYIETLGCPRNDVESDLICGDLDSNGYEVVSDPEFSEVIIVNTCGFIEPAKQESIDTILELAKFKNNGCRALLVVGCLAQRYPKAILKEIPEVDGVVGIEDTKRLNELIPQVISENRLLKVETPAKQLHEPRLRKRPDLPYAYLQIADGCDNACSFCVLPLIRGKYRSRPQESLVKEAQFLASHGVKELNLVAQDIGRYGVDLYGEKLLTSLINAISKVDGIEWIRLLYLEPQNISTKLLEVIKENPKVCSYINIPFQHGSDKILRRMNRWGNRKRYLNLIKMIREAVPDITLRTNFIVGFPGESEKDFGQLIDFIEAAGLDYAGIFEYSPEENTESFKFPNQVPNEVIRERYHWLIEVQDEIGWEKARNLVGTTAKTLIEDENQDGFRYLGRIESQAPEIDGEVLISKGSAMIGEFAEVKITKAEQYDLVGEIDAQSS